MRLWHKDLIPVLPRQQLIGQWRECCLIAKQISEKGTPNHILVNKIMDYPIEHFWWYGNRIACEMECRGYKVDFAKFAKWLTNPEDIVTRNDLFKNWHNYRYLIQNFYNLEEKFDCGGISNDEWEEIARFMVNRFGNEDQGGIK